MQQISSIETDEAIILNLVESLVQGRIDYVINILSALSSVEKDAVRVLLQSPISGNDLAALFAKADLSISLLPLFRAALTVTNDLQKSGGGDMETASPRRAFERILSTPDVVDSSLAMGTLDRLVRHLEQ